MLTEKPDEIIRIILYYYFLSLLCEGGEPYLLFFLFGVFHKIYLFMYLDEKSKFWRTVLLISHIPNDCIKIYRIGFDPISYLKKI